MFQTWGDCCIRAEFKSPVLMFLNVMAVHKLITSVLWGERKRQKAHCSLMAADLASGSRRDTVSRE